MARIMTTTVTKGNLEFRAILNGSTITLVNLEYRSYGGEDDLYDPQYQAKGACLDIVLERECDDETGRSWSRRATIQDLEDLGYETT
jgi:hypothetical protein